MKKLSVQILFFAVFLTSGSADLPAQNAESSGETIKAKIYLLDNFESENLARNLDLFAVERAVNKNAPLRSALEAQMTGATEEENSQALYSPATEIKLISVVMKNKIARAYFTRTENSEALSERDALLFKNSVKRTALQFRFVRRIEICLDGVSDFWLVTAKSHKKCAPKK